MFSAYHRNCSQNWKLYFSKLLYLFPKTCPFLSKLLSFPFAYLGILSITQSLILFWKKKKKSFLCLYLPGTVQLFINPFPIHQFCQFISLNFQKQPFDPFNLLLCAIIHLFIDDGPSTCLDHKPYRARACSNKIAYL